MGRYKIRTAFKIQSQQFKKHIANTVNWTETKPKKKKNSKKKLEERAKPCSAIKKRRGAGSGIQRWRKILMSARPKKKKPVVILATTTTKTQIQKKPDAQMTKKRWEIILVSHFWCFALQKVQCGFSFWAMRIWWTMLSMCKVGDPFIGTVRWLL